MIGQDRPLTGQVEMLGCKQEPAPGVLRPGRVVGRSNIRRPPADAYETNAYVIVKVEVAGIRRFHARS